MSKSSENATRPVIITAKVTPKSKKERIIRETPTDDSVRYRIYVQAAPDGGKANAAVIRILAKTFGVPQSHITIVSGKTSRNKTIRIDP